MVATTLIVGAIVLVVLLVLGFILHKGASETSYAAYYPAFLMTAVGLILLLMATMTKVDIMGAGYGGLGIATLFASAITMIVLSIAQAKPDTN